jgi:hypothetical protein
VITLLATDGKEYKYRLEKMDKDKERDPGSLAEEYEALLATQTLEIVNSQLKLWRESAMRKL